jgi:NADPH-dependent ferric siderophore reductase
MKRRLLDGLGSRLRIIDVLVIGSSMRLLRIGGPDVSGWRWSPGQHVRVQVGALPGPLDLLAGQRRTYSVWNIYGDTIEVCVYDHGEGPGAEWARSAQPGDEIVMTAPRGEFVLRPSEFHLFVGDETAMPPIGAMIGAVPSCERARAVLEIGADQDALPVPGAVTWLYVNGHRFLPICGHQNSPLVAMFSPHLWPSVLPGGLGFSDLNGSGGRRP